VCDLTRRDLTTRPVRPVNLSRDQKYLRKEITSVRP
jgi:hypothetical protein